VFAEIGATDASDRPVRSKEEEDACVIELGKPPGVLFLSDMEVAPEAFVAVIHSLSQDRGVILFICRMTVPMLYLEGEKPDKERFYETCSGYRTL